MIYSPRIFAILFLMGVTVSSTALAGTAEMDSYNNKAKSDMEQYRRMNEYREKGGFVAEEYRKAHPSGPKNARIVRTGGYSIELPEVRLRLVLAEPEPVQRKPYELGPSFTKSQYPDNSAPVSAEGHIQYGDIMLHRVDFHTFESCQNADKIGETYTDEDSEEYVVFPCSTSEFKRQKKHFSGKGKNNKFTTKCHYDTPSGGFLAESITFVGDVRISVFTSSEMGCEPMRKELKQVLQLIQFKKMK